MRASASLRLALPVLLAALSLPARGAPVEPAPEGIQFAYLSTGGPGTGLGRGSTGADLSGDGVNEADPASFTMTFDALAGTEVSFALNLLTGEITGGVPDFVQVVLNGVVVEQATIGRQNSTIPIIDATSFDSVDDDLLLNGPDGSNFADGQTGWRTFSLFTQVEGPQELIFRILDESDDIVDSALLIDDIRFGDELVEGFEDFEFGSAPVPSPFLTPVYAIVGNVTVANAGSFFEVEDLPDPDPNPVPLPAVGAGLLVASALGLRARRRPAPLA